MFPSVKKPDIRDSSLTERACSILLVHRAAVAQDLNVEAVIDPLIGDLVLVPDDAELIRAEATSRRRATKLLDIISKKGQNGFNCFQKSLVETHNHLAILLKEGVTIEGVCWSPGMSPEILTKEEGVQATPCNADMNHEGDVTSPNYPDAYGYNKGCSTTITAGVGQVVSLTFVRFNLEPEYKGHCYDFLDIFNGEDHIGEYCGLGWLPSQVTSTGRELTLYFRIVKTKRQFHSNCPVGQTKRIPRDTKETGRLL